eukprot:GHVU01025381.1.p2 GENE.GHVU01025381.1~~GHVU01025381.1.p2  ORF type:complete len:155 (+),score=21.24 GHVU01025381.1:1594-2058(+)
MKLAEEHMVKTHFTFDRKEEKQHGEGGNLVGDGAKPGARVLIVDDVISSGISVAGSGKMVKDLGCNVIAIVLGLDREECAGLEWDSPVASISTTDALSQKLNVPVYSLVSLTEIIHYLRNDGRAGVTDEQVKDMIEYSKRYGAPKSKVGGELPS